MFRLQRIRSAIERLLSPGYAVCRRCRRPWTFVRPHVTASGSVQCFALCTLCWETLNPAQRMGYYNQLIREWRERSTDDTVTERRARALRSAVIQGL